MEEYQKRVIEEKAQLDGKIKQLGLFLRSNNFHEVVKNESEKSRLASQYEIMVYYSSILNERIIHF